MCSLIDGLVKTGLFDWFHTSIYMKKGFGENGGIPFT